MKKIAPLFLILALVGLLAAPGQPALAGPGLRLLSAPASPVSPALQSQLDALQPGGMLTVIVTLRPQADLTRVQGQLETVRALQAAANATQGPLQALLAARQGQGQVQRFESLWILNGFSVTAARAVVDELAQQPDVYSITADQVEIVPALAAPEPNLTVVRAPELWSRGYTGQGVVVASLDSGVDASHPDLAGRWRGGSNSWYDPYGQHPSTPIDLSGHGTETMGIVVGGDSGGTTVGMAPGARWIAARIWNDQGGSTATAVHQSFQWVLNPDGNASTADAPQVVNNSWSLANPGCDLTFEPDLQALRAAGILPVFAAGNGGPSSGTSYSPANNPSAFAVGAIDNNSQVYAYSSRGPSTCGGSTGPFPELVAPGVNIYTTGRYGTYAVDSGTSFAAPHVAGGLALLLSAYPGRSAADQERALTSSAADLGPAGPDDTFGYGRLDLLAAFNWLATAPTATPLPPTNTPTPAPTATPAPVTSLHVGDLDRAATKSGTKWNASVTISVHDSAEKLVANATVSGKWTNGASGSVTCTTTASGTCVVAKSGLGTKTASVTFSVTGITHATLTYQATSNHDPDGDSNGTTILVPKP